MTTAERDVRRSRVVAAVGGASLAAISVSRATDPETLSHLASGIVVEEMATVAGRTVWRGATHRVVVEQPNDWGWVTPDPPPGGLVVEHRTTPSWAHRSATAQRLRKRLESLPRVVVACGYEAPWFVLLLPVDAHRAQEEAERAGVMGVSALGPGRPELPGGLRVEVPSEADPAWYSACVASVAAVLD